MTCDSEDRVRRELLPTKAGRLQPMRPGLGWAEWWRKDRLLSWIWATCHLLRFLQVLGPSDSRLKPGSAFLQAQS